jgi:hypothetical protein
MFGAEGAGDKKSCRPRRGGSRRSHLVGCVNGRPVDSPLSAQPSGTVSLRHVTTSFRERNPSRRDHCEIAAGRLSPRPSPENDATILPEICPGRYRHSTGKRVQAKDLFSRLKVPPTDRDAYGGHVIR